MIIFANSLSIYSLFSLVLAKFSSKVKANDKKVFPLDTLLERNNGIPQDTDYNQSSKATRTQMRFDVFKYTSILSKQS
jgi:hypothetical protein